MNRTFAITFVVGIAVVAIAVAGVLLMQRGARIGLLGEVLKVRMAPLDENSSVAVIDFRVQNPSNVVFVVRSVKVLMEEKDGKLYESQVVSEMDAKRLFEGLPLLGQKFNETLLMNDKIAAHSSVDRMVAARFEAPESRLQARKRLVIRIEEVDGAVSEFAEK
jgi:hypothetical protein